MPISTRTFRVFVSSTFDDLKAERNALQEKVFPELAKFCVERGARFQAIDLRWGVREEATLDQRTMEICLAEIARCQATKLKPNFIVLLGDRYGWRPLPTRVEKDEFEGVLACITAGDLDSVKHWYRLDRNAVPPEYLLIPRERECKESSQWSRVEARIGEALRKAARAAGLPKDKLVKYEASATHQEILAGLGHEAKDREHVFAFIRNPTGPKDPLLRELITSLPRDFPEIHVIPFPEGALDVLCQEVTEHLKTAMAQPFQSRSALEQEREAQETFARERRQHFVGRKAILDEINAYLESNDARPLWVHGPSGSGKSSILARASGARAGICRFIGVTPESSTGITLLRSLCAEVGELYGQTGDLPATFNELAVLFRDRLKLATAARPLVLYLDALDRLNPQEPVATMDWLPSELPPYCRMVLSTTESTAALRDTNAVEIQAFSNKEANETLDLLLTKAKRTLQDAQREKVLTSFERTALPLFLKLAFEEARLWRSFDPIEECVLGEGLAGIIERLFTRLSQAANHGEVLVTHALGFLEAARYGLAEDEILAVLAANDSVWEDFEKSKKHDLPLSMQSQGDRKKRLLPVIVWSRLYLDLAPYLSERVIAAGTTLGFFHQQFSEAIGPAAEHHQSLADYFRRRADPGRDCTWKVRDPRPLSELPYHLTSGGFWRDLDGVLSDPVFGEARCIATGAYALGSDCQYALRAHASAAVQVTAAAVRGGLAALLERPELSLQTLVNRMAWLGRDDPTIQEGVARAIQELDRRGPWIQAECAYPTDRALSLAFSVVAVAQCSSRLDRITVVDEGGDLLVFDLALGLIEKRQGVVSGKVVAIQATWPDRIVWLDSQAIVRVEGTTHTLRVRKGECRIVSLPDRRVIAVDPEDRMVLWSLETGSITVLVEHVPPPVRVLRLSANGGVICVAGRSPQRLLVLNADLTASTAMDLSWGEAAIMDADLDQSGQGVLLLCADRTLRLVFDTPGAPTQVLRYEQAVPKPIWGAPLRCALGLGDSAGWAFFATQDGEVGAWNWRSAEVRRLPDFGGPQHENILLFEFPRGSAHLRVGLQTGTYLMDESTEAKDERAHNAPVTACAITARGTTVSVSHYDGAVCWHEPRTGLRLRARRELHRVTAISSIGNGDDVVIGTGQGWCWRQTPDRDAERNEIWCLFDRSVAAVVAVGESIVAADVAGRAMSLDQAGSTELLRPETGRIQQIALQPGDDLKRCWSLHALTTTGDITYRLTRWNGSEFEHEVYHTTKAIASFSVSADQRRLCVGGTTAIVFAIHNAGAQELYRRELPVLSVRWMRNDLNLAVMPSGGRWLEVWSVSTGLPTFAAVDLPGPAGCMAVRADSISVGFGSGDLLRFRLRVPLE